MLGQAPLRHHRAAAAHDAGDALGRQRHMGQPHAGMDGEVVDALLALLDQRVAIDLPRELGGIAADLLQRLVDRHGADRHRRIAHDPFARVVDVAAGRQVHDRVGAPADRPHHLLDLFLHRGGDRRVADVGVDLHQEIAADRHRLELAVVDVGRDDGAAHRHFLAHELGRDELGQRRAKALAVGQPLLGEIERHLAAEILALGDVDHFLGDDAGARPFELGDRLAVEAAQRPRRVGERQQRRGLHVAVVDRPGSAGRHIPRRRRVRAPRRGACAPGPGARRWSRWDRCRDRSCRRRACAARTAMTARSRAEARAGRAPHRA